jgi:formate hydrogenlyase subunit 4
VHNGAVSLHLNDAFQRFLWFLYLLVAPRFLIGSIVFGTGFAYAMLSSAHQAKSRRRLRIVAAVALAMWLAFIALAASGEMP